MTPTFRGDTHARAHTRTHSRNLFSYLFICLLTYYFLCPAEPPHGKVPLAVSDTCGGNAARGGRRRVPNFNTNLVAVCQHAARPQTEKKKDPDCGFWAAQLRLPLARSSDRPFLTLPLFPRSCFPPPPPPPRRWLWTAAGACGGRGSSAPGRVGAGWSSPTGSAPTRCPRTEGSTARARGSSTSPATRSRAATMTVRLINVVSDIDSLFLYLQLLLFE